MEPKCICVSPTSWSQTEVKKFRALRVSHLQEPTPPNPAQLGPQLVHKTEVLWLHEPEHTQLRD
jgi:hypothetical protein